MSGAALRVIPVTHNDPVRFRHEMVRVAHRLFTDVIGEISGTTLIVSPTDSCPEGCPHCEKNPLHRV